MRHRHSFAFHVFVLWILGLGFIDVWRGIVLWKERMLLFELGSTLSPLTLALLAALFVVVGLCLIAAAAGLRWHRGWAPGLTRAAILSYFLLIQSYTWLFVRTGLMWQRRGISLVLALLGICIGVGSVTWLKARRYLGL